MRQKASGKTLNTSLAKRKFLSYFFGGPAISLRRAGDRELGGIRVTRAPVSKRTVRDRCTLSSAGCAAYAIVARREFEMQNGNARWMRPRGGSAWDFLRSWERYGLSWTLYGSLGIFQPALWGSAAFVMESYRSRTLIKSSRFDYDFSKNARSSVLRVARRFNLLFFSRERCCWGLLAFGNCRLRGSFTFCLFWQLDGS